MLLPPFIFLLFVAIEVLDPGEAGMPEHVESGIGVCQDSIWSTLGSAGQEVILWVDPEGQHKHAEELDVAGIGESYIGILIHE